MYVHSAYMRQKCGLWKRGVKKRAGNLPTNLRRWAVSLFFQHDLAAAIFIGMLYAVKITGRAYLKCCNPVAAAACPELILLTHGPFSH